MGKLRIGILLALAVVLLVAGLLTWGSIGSIVLFFCLGAELLAILMQKFVFTDRENDFAED